ncbi:Zn-dependent exopeptidase [Basidiobolus meristosporus CBS 931.73]|uniref:Peptide hydrolase n=1 Tax=Basidiobolus meristosporus CBS 931.73 TaxID=1314790 RepID=A0A1Y1Y5V1_9FUNG|nr:Zn-dependent exopeptidase [Basidiobolus meristosporus CBS 931.73]|eukprot:ORX93358.1 Zn-dependent exopeptidase [Basidiobolus meristosporus CBS 931.73]
MVHLSRLVTLTALLLPFQALAYQQPFLSNSGEELRLIQTSDDSPARWLSESDVNQLIRMGIRFMDITENQDLSALDVPARFDIPRKPTNQKLVKSYIRQLQTEPMKQALTKLTSFKTRYYKSETGAASSRWLFSQIQEIIDSSAKVNVTARFFKHSWPQSSIIARFEGTEEGNDETVILSAHQDSINQWLPWFGAAPGADDDGSGTVTVLEAFRVLVNNGFAPQRPVEFHWYAAEEAGLLGSQAVAREYRRLGRKVVGNLHSDMTGFPGSSKPVYGIGMDNTDPELATFVKKLVEQYATIPWKEMKCGYACSDHASWFKAGYRSAFNYESDNLESNPNIHTTRDTVETIDFNHCLQFSRVVVGFAVEMSQVKSTHSFWW